MSAPDEVASAIDRLADAVAELGKVGTWLRQIASAVDDLADLERERTASQLHGDKLIAAAILRASRLLHPPAVDDDSDQSGA